MRKEKGESIRKIGANSKALPLEIIPEEKLLDTATPWRNLLTNLANQLLSTIGERSDALLPVAVTDPWCAPSPPMGASAIPRGLCMSSKKPASLRSFCRTVTIVCTNISRDQGSTAPAISVIRVAKRRRVPI